MNGLGYYSSMKKIAGFTLIELMITLLVLGVVAGMAAPSMLTMMKNNKQTTRINQLAGLVNYARSEAVNQSTVVSACASDNATSCNTDKWEMGGLIFLGDASTVTTPSTANILKVIEPQASGSTLRRSSDRDPQPAAFSDRYLRYDGTGRLVPGDSGNFVLCDDRGATTAKALVINSVGQARNAVDTNDDGIVDIFIGEDRETIQCP